MHGIYDYCEMMTIKRVYNIKLYLYTLSSIIGSMIITVLNDNHRYNLGWEKA